MSKKKKYKLSEYPVLMLHESLDKAIIPNVQGKVETELEKTPDGYIYRIMKMK